MFTNYADVRGTRGSRFNTCKHTGGDGYLDCKVQVYINDPQFEYCELHFREKMGLFSNDPELNTLILEWREFFDKR